jgi:hypothetical protein
MFCCQAIGNTATAIIMGMDADWCIDLGFCDFGYRLTSHGDIRHWFHIKPKFLPSCLGSKMVDRGGGKSGLAL